MITLLHKSLVPCSVNNSDDELCWWRATVLGKISLLRSDDNIVQLKGCDYSKLSCIISREVLDFSVTAHHNRLFSSSESM